MRRLTHYIAALVFSAVVMTASFFIDPIVSLVLAESSQEAGMPVKVDIYGRILGDEFFFWRNTLSAEERLVYDQIYAHAIALEASVPVTANISVDRTLSVLEAVRYDNPELFWLDYSLITYYNALNRVVSLEIAFYPEAGEVFACYDAFVTRAEALLRVAAELSNDADKVKFIHDYLVEVNNYKQETERDQSAYGAVVLGESVCMGYSLAFEYYMQRLGIPCALVVGEARGEAHAWNLIMLGGEYYNIDVTWNDPVGLPSGSFSYDYFNLPDQKLTDRTRLGVCEDFPAATGTWFSFENYYGSREGSDFSAVTIY